jgi:hypothetical protein
MKLTEFDQNKLNNTTQALKENYNISLNLSKMSLPASRTMLTKVRNLISEAKQSSNFYSNQSNASYMKLVFMEQALYHHLTKLSSKLSPQIVVENEEVDKSQVVLAAQDMVDSVQKMIIDVSDMLVKELPALVDSIQSEIGVNESGQFNSQATEALTSLQAALSMSQTSLKDALGTITGQGNSEEFQPDMDDTDSMVEPDPIDGGTDEFDLDVPNEEIPEPEEMPVTSVGRAKR